MQTSKDRLRTLANGIIPAGFDAKKLPLEGCDEVRAAIDVLLELSNRRTTKLTLALSQLNKAALEIDRLRENNKKLASWMSAALDDPQVCQEMKSDIHDWFGGL